MLALLIVLLLPLTDAHVTLCNVSDATVSHQVLTAARRLAERGRLSGASMAEIAQEAGIARMTLYRRGETREAIVRALRQELARDERDLLLPLLASEGSARDRLERVLQAVCRTTDQHADLLTGLDSAMLNAIYHEEGDDALTRSEFVAPIVRLLRDGALDGSLRTFPDPDEAATVLYTQVSYTYLHLRREHRWSAERATHAVTEIALLGSRP
jgi:AcrR family transcriptional regulator